MELILTNKNGQHLDLLNNDSKFILSSCEALHGVDTDIGIIESPYFDGGIVENVKALPRGISMTFTLVPNIKDSIDFFTSVVKSKQFVQLTEKEKNREITIKGVATIPPYTRMMALCKIQLDIYCPQPYWEDINSFVNAISMFIDLLNFPTEGQYFTPTGRPFGAIDIDSTRVFKNEGDVSVGMNIKITALSSVNKPCISCASGEQYGWYMYLDLSLSNNDEVEINTERGNKYIKINGSEYFNGQPVLSYLKFSGTDWLQLETGENTFKVGTYNNGEIVPNENIFFTITYKRRYE